MNDNVPKRRVLLVVSGGIAAYKAPELVRALVARGCDVQVIMTAAAKAFVTELSLATVSRRPVRSSLLDVSEEGQVGHIELADWPDLVVVAPATADVMARAAHGLANDLATTCLLATRAPVLWAPAMNVNMWRHEATRANLRRLADRGDAFVGPDRGELACGWIGEGRMMDPSIIADAAHGALVRAARRDLEGRTVLVSAGPTRTYVDPVRFLTNASTGAMGFALAAAAKQRGAEVVLVSGPVQQMTPAGVERIDVTTAPELLAAMRQVLQRGAVDLVAMVAAVSDLELEARQVAKLDKASLVEHLSAAQWSAGVDVLATLTTEHEGDTKFLGFAAETVGPEIDPRLVNVALVERATAKLTRKRCDAVFVNRVGVPQLGFESSTNAGMLVYAEGDSKVDVSGDPRLKTDLAEWILDRLVARWFS